MHEHRGRGAEAEHEDEPDRDGVHLQPRVEHPTGDDYRHDHADVLHGGRSRGKSEPAPGLLRRDTDRGDDVEHDLRRDDEDQEDRQRVGPVGQTVRDTERESPGDQE